MSNLKRYEFWFITGSQHLYGPETLKQVAEHSEIIAKSLNEASEVPCTVVFKPIVTTPDEITKVIKEANYDENCAGIITWMHTFSPSKMWINGLSILEKPYCHLHTQYNRTIPNEGIDMDFMNLINLHMVIENMDLLEQDFVCLVKLLLDTGKIPMLEQN